jgi:two-component sensor histidine kinase
MAIAGGDKGLLQAQNRHMGLFPILAQRGFQESFLTLLESGQKLPAACVKAMRSQTQVIIQDVRDSELFVGDPSQKAFLDAGVRAVIATPLISSKKIALGVVSTHFDRPHRPSEQDLRLIGLLARQAADYLGRKRAEEIEKTLSREIQHRANNLLTIVQSIVNRTLSDDRTIDQAKEAVNSRLGALARANRRLSKSEWSGLDLVDTVGSELGPFSDRIQFGGPDIALNSQQGQNFVLTLHELATNAAKYGALSTPEGTVDIFWTISRDGERSVLKFRWRESGGPSVAPPIRRGFGSSLISAAFPGARLNYLPTGLTCEIEIELGDITETPSV